MNVLTSAIKTIFHYPVFFLFVLFCTLTIVPIVKASLTDFYDAQATEGQNRPKFSASTFADTENSISGQIVGGCDKSNCPEEFKVGVLTTTTNMIAGLYSTPPASGITYFADVFQRFNPVQPAYAQTPGTGFNALSPVLPIWKAFRNFAYVFFAIVFIFIGIAIMFRMKLDPRTVLTIQSAIPRIVIALLLVTFSYAIAGLLIDLLYLLIALVATIFGGIPGFFPGPDPAAKIQSEFLDGGFGQIAGKVFVTTFGLGGAGIPILAPGIGAMVIGAIIAISNPAGWIVLAGGALSLLIVLITILFLLFKLFFELLKAYIMILVLVILAPLQIALGAIPGMPGFGQWFKNIMANILVFPAVAFVLLIAQVLVQTAGGGKMWVAPMLSGGWLLSSAVPLLIGLGFMFIVNQVPQAIKTMFGIRGLGFAVGENMGPVRAPFGAAGSTLEGLAKDPARSPRVATGLYAAAGVLKRMGGGR